MIATGGSSGAKPLASITGYGITTSVGGNTAQSCAALRAGIVRFEPSDLHYCFGYNPEDGKLEMPTVAPVFGLDPHAAGITRWLALALPALAEAIQSAGMSRADLAKASLHVAFPDGSRPAAAGLDETFVAELSRRGAFPMPARTSVARAGNSGFCECLDKALEFLAQGGVHALILCVDSLIGGDTLRWLDRTDRLKCSRAPEGIIAGEGAAAIVLTRYVEREGAAGGGRSATAEGPTKPPPSAHILSYGRAKETNTVFAETVCTGEGLTNAVRAAAAKLPPPEPPTWVISDLNGERYRALEWGYVATRVHDLLPSVRHLWYIADALGDAGAATGGIAAARVCAAFERDYAPAKRAWILLGSDEGGRAAIVLGAVG